MDYMTPFLVFVLTLPGIFSDAFPRVTREETADVLQCDFYCSQWQRVCSSPPYTCGGCRHRYRNRDGDCLPLDQDEYQEEELRENELADEVVGPNGANAIIPDNAHIDRILHAPGHSQERKVQDVYKMAAVDEFPGDDDDREDDVYPANPDIAADPQALRMDADSEADAKRNNIAAVKDMTNMADVYFLVKNTDKRDPNEPDTSSEPPGGGEVASFAAPPDSDTEVKTILIYSVVAGCSIAGLVGLVVAGVCWYRLQKNVKAASEAEYPAYGVTGPVPDKVGSPGDRKLAQSAQMYHYQHQKQQMIAMEKANGDMTKDGSDADSEEENEEGDYTVYECPGLAPTGEMEVKNPLFSEETPVTPSEPSAPPK